MTDTTPAPEGVTPEQVAAKDAVFAAETMRSWSERYAMVNPAGAVVAIHSAADMLEALAADLAAQTARADAADDLLREWQANQHYRYIGKDGKSVMARDLEDRAEVAEAKVARLVEVLTWTDMELAKLSGLWHDVSPRKKIRAIIAEVQG